MPTLDEIEAKRESDFYERLPFGGGLLGFLAVGAKPYKPTWRDRIKDAWLYLVATVMGIFALAVVGLGLRDIVLFMIGLFQ